MPLILCLPLGVGFQERIVFIAARHVATGLRGVGLLEGCQGSERLIALGTGLDDVVVLTRLVVPFLLTPGVSEVIGIGPGGEHLLLQQELLRVAHLLEPLQHPLQAPKVWSHTKMERGNHGRPIHSQGGNDLMVNKDSICSRGICSLI